LQLRQAGALEKLYGGPDDKTRSSLQREVYARRRQAGALEKLYGGLDDKTRSSLQREVYARVLAISPAGWSPREALRRSRRQDPELPAARGLREGRTAALLVD